MYALALEARYHETGITLGYVILDCGCHAGHKDPFGASLIEQICHVTAGLTASDTP